MPLADEQAARGVDERTADVLALANLGYRNYLEEQEQCWPVPAFLNRTQAAAGAALGGPTTSWCCAARWRDETLSGFMMELQASAACAFDEAGTKQLGTHGGFRRCCCVEAIGTRTCCGSWRMPGQQWQRLRAAVPAALYHSWGHHRTAQLSTGAIGRGLRHLAEAVAIRKGDPAGGQ